MALYDIQCPMCGTREVYASIHTVGQYIECPVCCRPRPRLLNFHFHHTEDRTRLWRGPNGDRYSYALGEDMPESRAERDRLAKKKNIEFCSLAELRADNKEAAAALDYKAHVDSGGLRDDSRPEAAPVWRQKPSWAKGLA